MKRLLLFILLLQGVVYSQTQPTLTYPKITGYFGILHPIVSISNEKPGVNFDKYYAIGFPTGINIWKNEKIGFSFEFVPLIRVENGTDKLNSLLFHPGILVSLGHGYNFAGRLAFDTNGRYGVTPVFNKTILKTGVCSFYAAIPLAVRFGNGHPANFTPGFQFGIAF